MVDNPPDGPGNPAWTLWAAFRFWFAYFTLFCPTTQIISSLLAVPVEDIDISPAHAALLRCPRVSQIARLSAYQYLSLLTGRAFAQQLPCGRYTPPRHGLRSTHADLIRRRLLKERRDLADQLAVVQFREVRKRNPGAVAPA